jgi:glycosyltransferase involved in cell wall biosynthesis
MKILFVTRAFYPATNFGGPIFSTYNACLELSKLDNVIINVSTTNTNFTTRLDVESNIPVHLEEKLDVIYYNDTFLNVFSWKMLRYLWKDVKSSDIVHVQTTFNLPALLGLVFAKIYRKPTVFSPRGALCQWCLSQNRFLKKTWLTIFAPLYKRALWHATAQSEKDDIHLVYPDVDVTIISNGIHIHEYEHSVVYDRNEFMKKFAHSEKSVSKIVISMGRIHKKKGYDILIQSFAKIQDKAAALLIAGVDEGGEQIVLESLINQLGLKDRVFFIGQVLGQDKIDFLANADLFALTSHDENFGNVYAESLASRTPIIATKKTPWQDVEKYHCGRWIDNDIDTVTNTLNELLVSDLSYMGENGKRYIAKYDWKNVATKFFQDYSNLIEKKDI